jgi:hypothetical protein
VAKLSRLSHAGCNIHWQQGFCLAKKQINIFYLFIPPPAGSISMQNKKPISGRGYRVLTENGHCSVYISMLPWAETVFCGVVREFLRILTLIACQELYFISIHKAYRSG